MKLSTTLLPLLLIGASQTVQAMQPSKLQQIKAMVNNCLDRHPANRSLTLAGLSTAALYFADDVLQPAGYERLATTIIATSIPVAFASIIYASTAIRFTYMYPEFSQNTANDRTKKRKRKP